MARRRCCNSPGSATLAATCVYAASDLTPEIMEAGRHRAEAEGHALE